MIGKTISHYEILEELGCGGMGVVYRARDLKLDREVALKFLSLKSADKTEKARFIHEAKASSKLDHSNICTVHEIDETSEGELFIVMACYHGETLKDIISKGPLPLEKAMDFAVQIAMGLKEAHDHGIVHRDIKSANIMVTSRGQVKIMDFGLALLSGGTKLTKTGTTLGTVSYMSPEQTRGEQVDRRTDVWSLGVLLYEMLTGQLPFKGEYEQAVVYSILDTEAQPITGQRTGIPLELEHIVTKALAKDPDKRYSSMDDLLVDFRRIDLEKKDQRRKPLSPGDNSQEKDFIQRPAHSGRSSSGCFRSLVSVAKKRRVRYPGNAAACGSAFRESGAF